MKSISLCFVVLLFLNVISLAQAPDTAWTRSYDRGSWDECRWITETSDNGFALVGVSQISGNNWVDIMLVKTDANGDMLWSRTYGDTIVGQDANCVKEDYDGGYVIAGIKYLTLALRNAWIIKTDSAGDTIWTYLYGGDNNVEAQNIVCTSDSGYAITGVRYDPGEFGNAYLLKLDKNGEFEWSRTYGAGGYEDGYIIEQTQDGGYMIAGTKNINTRSHDYYLIKTDENGSVEWSNTYGGDNTDLCTSAKQTSDGGYVLYGQSDSNIPNSAMALKVNADGDSLWCINYQRSNGDYGYSVDECSDGGLIFGGFSNNPGYRDDYWFLRTNADGDTLWSKTVGYGDDQRGYCVAQTADDGYILAGYSPNAAPTFGDFYVVKLNAEPTSVDDDMVLPSSFSLKQNYPNPFNAQTEISYTLQQTTEIHLAIYDVLGREIELLYDGTLQAGEYSIIWNAEEHPSGIYFAKLIANDRTESVKMVYLK